MPAQSSLRRLLVVRLQLLKWGMFPPGSGIWRSLQVTLFVLCLWLKTWSLSFLIMQSWLPLAATPPCHEGLFISLEVQAQINSLFLKLPWVTVFIHSHRKWFIDKAIPKWRQTSNKETESRQKCSTLWVSKLLPYRSRWFVYFSFVVSVAALNPMSVKQRWQWAAHKQVCVPIKVY